MADIRVAIGGTGRMGAEMLAGLARAQGIEPVGVVEAFGQAPRVPLPGGGTVPVSADARALFETVRPDVLVDFSHHEWTEKIAPIAVEMGVRPVIGTTGLSPAWVESLAESCGAAGVGGVVAANFAVGAVLMMHFAAVAARYFDVAEVIELHHDRKIDAPSGTALATARDMVAARGRPFDHPETEKQTIAGTRGGTEGGVTIHSVRLPGLVAHQEVLFGGLGQILTIRHDSTSRESFLPGVELAVRSVMERRELVVGLDRLMGLTRQQAMGSRQ